MCTPDIFLGLLAILFPPVAVWIKVGVCSADSLINIALCCLGYVPGLLHAWYIIVRYPEPDDEYPEGYQPIVPPGAGYQDRESGNGQVTYYYVAHEPHHQQYPQENRTYGTTPPFSRQYAAPPPPPVPQRPSPSAQNPPGQKHDSHPASAAEGSSGTAEHPKPPPTYAEAVTGDHKIQSHD